MDSKFGSLLSLETVGIDSQVPTIYTSVNSAEPVSLRLKQTPSQESSAREIQMYFWQFNTKVQPAAQYLVNFPLYRY